LNTKNIIKLLVFHLLIITLSNYLVQFPFESFGFISTWGMFTYPLLILASDLTVRLSNENQAKQIVTFAYLPAIMISVYLENLRIGIASASAYFIGQILDIFIFQKIRKTTKQWWIAPLMGSFISNIFDTYFFFFIAFYKSSDKFMANSWLKIATNDLLFKILISTIVFLPLYGILLKIFIKKTRDFI